MFNNDRLERIESRIKDLERNTKVYIERGTVSVSDVLYLLLNHLHLQLKTTDPTTILEEFKHDETKA